MPLYLKNLTLKGFKSFADATTLDLEPGVTVVVGPNGSGKSNVVDAIAWVLGAQAPSAVRSQKMDDVIFAGTAKKAALGRAEVALTIDNSSGTLPVEFSEVKITRTLFRSGDSEYAINGVPCRLLDITELLSDGGVGRQQHVIVSQGQIDAVLNARPEERRSIVEEAAGVLKYRRRKERAERRLAATEGDLTRVKDLMREVRRQLRPLEKQAEAARRHGDLIAELEALRIHLAGREVAELRTALQAIATARSERGPRQAEARDELDRISAEISASEQQLAAQGGDDLGDTLVRLESLRERGKGLAAVIAERRRGVEREQSAFTDRAVIANVEAEAERTRRDLAAVESDAAALSPELERLHQLEQQLKADRQQFEAEWGDGVPVPSGQAAEVRGELGALRAAIERGASEAQRLNARLDDLAARRESLEAGAAQQRAELAALHDEEEPLVASHEAAQQRHQETSREAEAAAERLGDSEAELHRWTARAEALTLALAEARSQAGAQRLAEVEGVLGTLLDLVEVDEGWEAAFGAAAGESLRAVVVRDPNTARRALDELQSASVAGAVLALGAHDNTSTAPGEVRSHVRGIAPGVDELLDRLVGSVRVIDGDWSDALDAALAAPERIVVTRAGDRFGASGWRVGAGGTGATGAALEEAEGRLAQARLATSEARDRCSRVRAELEQCARHEAELTERLDRVDTDRAAAATALQRIEADRRDVETEADALQGRVDELEARAARERERLDELEMTLPVLESGESDLIEKGRRLAAARADIEERSAAVGALRTDLEVRAAGLDERRQFLRSRLDELEARLERDVAERDGVREQRESLERKERLLARLAEIVSSRVSIAESELAGVRERRKAQSEAAQRIAAGLDEHRRARAAVEHRLDEIRTAAARADIEEAELRTRLQASVERLRAEFDVSPDVAVSAPCPELDDGVDATHRARQLESELEIMGPVNPLALEEYQTLQERHGFLQGQLDDIRSSRRELSKVIRSIDEEIVSVFAAAYADVAVNFEQLFETLFPGGEGGVRLTDPDDLLNTGIDIEAKPSGKNVRKLSLLSGGERTLTALAFLFAVFRSRPSPFYVMDEVEAALDDVNLHRFLSLIEEFRSDAQLVLVSHQKRTMEAADCLYGVSMKAGGSSRVVSEKVSTSSSRAA